MRPKFFLWYVKKGRSGLEIFKSESLVYLVYSLYTHKIEKDGCGIAFQPAFGQTGLGSWPEPGNSAPKPSHTHSLEVIL